MYATEKVLEQVSELRGVGIKHVLPATDEKDQEWLWVPPNHHEVSELRPL